MRASRCHIPARRQPDKSGRGREVRYRWQGLGTQEGGGATPPASSRASRGSSGARMRDLALKVGANFRFISACLLNNSAWNQMRNPHVWEKGASAKPLPRRLKHRATNSRGTFLRFRLPEDFQTNAASAWRLLLRADLQGPPGGGLLCGRWGRKGQKPLSIGVLKSHL